MTARRLLARVPALLLVAFLFCCCTPGAASAASNGRWSVYPTTPAGQAPRLDFEPVMAPGSTYPDSVTVVNQTAAPIHFDLYPADAFNAQGGGGFSLRRQSDPRRGIAAWIHLDASSITVPGRSAVIVPFTIVTPRHATPGYHVGGIVAESTRRSVSRNGPVGVAVVQAVGTRVYGRVLGPLRPSLRLGVVSLGVRRSAAAFFGGPVEASVHFTVRNTGNVPLDPTAVVSVSPLVGGGPAPVTTKLPEVLPGSSLSSSVSFPSAVPFGDLSAHVQVTATGTRAGAGSSQVVVPWGAVVVILVVVATLVAWRRSRRPPARRGGPHDQVRRETAAASSSPT